MSFPQKAEKDKTTWDTCCASSRVGTIIRAEKLFVAGLILPCVQHAFMMMFS